MIEAKPVSAAPSDEPAKAAATKPGDAYPMMRQLGGRAYQLLAAARGADHFIAQESLEDRDTGAWLISCAVGLAEELAADLDAMGRNLKAGGADAALVLSFQKLRARAHQLHAATRASDHFLEQDNSVDRSTRPEPGCARPGTRRWPPHPAPPGLPTAAVQNSDPRSDSDPPASPGPPRND